MRRRAGARRRSPQRPSRRRRCRSPPRRSYVRPAVSMLDVQVDAARRRPAARPAPARAARPASHLGAGKPVGRSAARRRAAEPRVQPRLAASTYGGWAVSRSREHEAGLGATRGELVDLRPRPFGVDVVGRQRRDAAPVVDAGARAAARTRSRSDEVGRRLDAHAAGRARAARRRRWRRSRRGRSRGVPHRGVGLGAEVLHDDFLDVPVLPGDPRIAKIDSTRSAAVSPMPIRMPVVNGDVGAAGVLEHPQPHRRVLVREPKCAPLRSNSRATWSRASCPSTVRPA